MKRPVATRALDLPLWLRWTKLLPKLSGPRAKHKTALARGAQGLLTTDKVPEWGKLISHDIEICHDLRTFWKTLNKKNAFLGKNSTSLDKLMSRTPFSQYV